MGDAEEANEEDPLHPCCVCHTSTRSGVSTDNYIKYDFLTNCFCCSRALCTRCRRVATTIGLHRGPSAATLCPDCEPRPRVDCTECNRVISLRDSSMCDVCDAFFCQEHIGFIARGTGYSPCCFGADCRSYPSSSSSSTPSTPSSHGDDGAPTVDVIPSTPPTPGADEPVRIEEVSV